MSSVAPRAGEPHAAPAGSRLGWIVVVTVSSAVSAWLVARTLQSVSGNRNAPWLIGRASGISCYVMLVALVAVGLGLSHPWRTRVRKPSSATRIRIHIGLAVFTLALLILHIVVLATDKYAKVGWAGAFLPMQSEYRPAAITMGVIGAYAGILAGTTAMLAGRIARRLWWPIHKVAIVTLVLVWLHALLAGTDAKPLLLLYVVTAFGILVLAASRYLARPPMGLVTGMTGQLPVVRARSKS